MAPQSFYTRQMLLNYGKQLIAARRLARYEQFIGHSHPASSEELLARRRAMVERITREIIDNLLFSGSENEIVVKVRERLSQEMGEEYIFRYPPAETDFLIFRKTEDGSEEELTRSERGPLMENLWNVALRTVDETML